MAFDLDVLYWALVAVLGVVFLFTLWLWALLPRALLAHVRMSKAMVQLAAAVHSWAANDVQGRHPRRETFEVIDAQDDTPRGAAPRAGHGSSSTMRQVWILWSVLAALAIIVALLIAGT